MPNNKRDRNEEVRKKGFASHAEYRNDLARKKGFAYKDDFDFDRLDEMSLELPEKIQKELMKDQGQELLEFFQEQLLEEENLNQLVRVETEQTDEDLLDDATGAVKEYENQGQSAASTYSHVSLTEKQQLEQVKKESQTKDTSRMTEYFENQPSCSYH